MKFIFFFVNFFSGFDIVVRFGIYCVLKFISLRKFFILDLFVGFFVFSNDLILLFVGLILFLDII